MQKIALCWIYFSIIFENFLEFSKFTLRLWFKNAKFGFWKIKFLKNYKFFINKISPNLVSYSILPYYLRYLFFRTKGHCKYLDNLSQHLYKKYSCFQTRKPKTDQNQGAYKYSRIIAIGFISSF